MADESLIVRIGANIAQFTRQMREVNKRILETQALAGNARLGSILTISPAIAPALAGITSVIGAFGPMLAVVAGGAAGLGASFATAGVGVAGFGAVAVSNLTSVFKASSDLSNAQNEYSKALTAKDRQKALDKEKQAWMGLDTEQKNALKSLQSFKSFWSGFSKSFQSPVLEIFSKSLNALQTSLTMAQPAIAEVARAINGLMNSLNASLKTDDVKAFFNYLGTSAGPAITALGQSFGNAMRGIMNLLVAFGSLASRVQSGLVEMTQSFATWTSGLSKSSKFQAFISYVETNGPKLLSIVGNIVSGLVGLFTAFAPMAGNMMTSLVGLTAGFNAWGQSLGQTDGFKTFIDYVNTNGPKLMSLIGNLVTLAGNLLVAMAPFGSATLTVVNAIAQFFNWLMQLNPAVGYVIVSIVQLIGVIKLLAPLYALLSSAAVKAVYSVIASFTEWLVFQAQLLTETLVTNAKIVASWIAMSVQSMANAVKVGAAWALSTGAAMATAVASTASAVARVVAQWVVMSVQSMANAAKVAAAWALSTGAALATAIARMVAQSAIFVAKWVWVGAQSLLQAARVAAAWFIALGPVGWVIGAIVGLVALIVANWSKVKSITITVFGAVWSFLKGIWDKTVGYITQKASNIWTSISNVWNKVLGFLHGINLYSVGRNILKGLINGVASMASSLVNKVKGVIGGAIQAAKNLLKIHSPSRVFMQIGQYTGQGMVIGMDRMSSSVANAANRMATATIPSVQTLNMPSMAFGDSNASQSKVNNNLSGAFSGATFVVREEADIDKIARKLADRLAINSRY